MCALKTVLLGCFILFLPTLSALETAAYYSEKTGILTLPALAVGDEIFHIELNLVDVENQLFQLSHASTGSSGQDQGSLPDTTTVEAFYSSSTGVLTLPSIEIGNNVYYIELRIVDTESLLFQVSLTSLVNISGDPDSIWTSDSALLTANQDSNSMQAAEAASSLESDLIFNYAEAIYPELLRPGAVSKTEDIYYYRHYVENNAYLGTADGRFYYYGPESNYQLLDLGTISYWLEIARAPHIISMTPDRGPVSQATEITIKGVNFTNAQISANGMAITLLSQSNTELRVRIPAGENGYVTVVVHTENGRAYKEFVRQPPSLSNIAPGEITTVAGVGLFIGDGRLAIHAMVVPIDLALAPNGDIYVAEPDQVRVRRIRADGVIETYAGNGSEGYSGDGGAAINAQLWQPRSIALDSQGNLFVVDAWPSRIRRVDAVTGVITTIAGTGVAGYSGDGGLAIQARLHYPVQLAFDSSGNLFVLESGNSVVRMINPSGIITTFAGNGTPGFSGDGGPATAAQINIGNGVFIDQGGIAADPAGNIYIADTDNNRVRRIDRITGIIDTVAVANGVRAVTTDALGNVYYAVRQGQAQDPRIIKLNPQMQTVATYGRGLGISVDGAVASSTVLGFIDRVRVDPQGNILFTDFTTSQVRRINITTGLLETVAGTGLRSIGETGPATEAILNNFNADIAFDSQGALLISDSGQHRIRKLDLTGHISTIAGNGAFGLREIEDIPAIDAQIIAPYGIDVTKDGALLIINGHDIRKIGVDGIIRFFAGNLGRRPGLAGDGGPADNARFTQPFDVVSDAAGNYYIADTNNNRVRRVDGVTGIVTTVAGSGATNAWEDYGAGSTCGDGGPALNACINTPYGVALDSDGNLFISENWERIRKVDSKGIISTFASVYATKLAIDAANNIFAVAGQRVVRISPQGTVTSVAGSGFNGFSGDGGPAAEANIHAPGQASGIAISSSGDLYFSDGGNRRIRAVKSGTLLAPTNATLSTLTPVITSAAASMVSVTLEVQLKDGAGDPAGGVQIRFDAPGSGATCRFNGGYTTAVITDRSGRAQATCSANINQAAYQISATPLGLASAKVFFALGE